MEPPPPRPKLSLKFSVSQNNVGSPSSNNPSQPPTPSAAAPQRTPSIKFKVKPSPAPTPSLPTTPNESGSTPGGSSKKRKREASGASVHARSAQKAKPPQLLKLITKNGPASASRLSAITPGIKLKTRGKIPKRPLGVGYDSELEDRELDPVILEAFVLRMQPGEDCDYIRECIANGTVGVSVLQKGADIRLRVLDVNGRRGILTVRGRQYAFTMVDLPTITEGMKSWDRKNFIKSVDISQMCLVLGRCSSDEEARTYPLPPDVNPKNYQYAHGLTPPMHNVRKRRFERTARARLDDIEAVERKVNSLLEADHKASQVTYSVLDYDPRDEESSADEYDSEEDAEGEDEDGYFSLQNGAIETQADQYTTEDISALEAMFEEGATNEMHHVEAPAIAVAQQPPSEALSSGGPSPAGAETPADIETRGDAETPAADADADADADFDDEGPDNDNDDDDDDEDQEAEDEKAETKAKIKEAEDKIAQQKAQLSGTKNQILKKKIAKKIQDLESDIRMMRRHAGLKDPVADDEEGEDGGKGPDRESEEE